MAKFCGVVGYKDSHEATPGVWTGVTERKHYGDVLKNSRRWESGQQINGEISLNNQIGIIADPYATAHYFAIRYVKWRGAYWTVTNVEVRHPRLILTIGGEYNGETA